MRARHVDKYFQGEIQCTQLIKLKLEVGCRLVIKLKVLKGRLQGNSDLVLNQLNLNHTYGGVLHFFERDWLKNKLVDI